MAKPFSLQPLLDLMQTRTDEAARRLGQLLAAEQSNKSRLKLLEEYREEYNQRFRETSQAGMTPLAWRNFLDFLSRIDEAIDQQRQIVAGSERDTTIGKDQWREQHKKLKAIDTLSDRHEASERQLEGKREQKLLDEFSARKKDGGSAEE